MLSSSEKNRPDWIELEERVIKEDDGKVYSKSNVSFDNKSNSKIPSGLHNSQISNFMSQTKN